MDMRLNEEQRMTRDVFTDFFAQECPSTLLRELEEGDGHSPLVWGKLAGMGGMALNLPAEFGGLEGAFTDLVLMYEAMGRCLYPSPHLWTVVVAAELILRLGSEAQKAATLHKIASGEAMLTLALTEKDLDDPASVQTTVSPDGDGLRVDGQKLFVEYAPLADYLLVVARTDQGVTLLLVPNHNAGITMTRHHEISGGQFHQVGFEAVAVSTGDLLGPIGQGAHPLNATLDRARVALAARMLGGCQAVFDLTLRYTKEREQFGQRVATFQNIAFRLAELQTRIDGARLLLYKTAWQIDQGATLEAEVAILKSLVNTLYRDVTSESIQIHGGFGFTEEADPQLYYRRAAVDSVLLGNTATMQARIADALELT